MIPVMSADKRRGDAGSLGDRLGRAILDADPLVAARSPRWWRSLPRKVAIALALAVTAAAAATYAVGGVDATASTLLRKQTRHSLPLGDRLARLAARTLARRHPDAGITAQLARLAHTVDPDDPLWPLVVKATASAVHHPIPIADVKTTLATLDTSAAAALGRPLDDRGVLGWQPIDPYFTQWVDDLASADSSLAIRRFNLLRPPDGLPTAEWYLDDLIAAFADARPIAFVLVADSTGDDWGPEALPPDQVPPHARRIGATTVGEALKVGLWAAEGYRPASPDVDVAAWWSSLASSRGLPVR